MKTTIKLVWALAVFSCFVQSERPASVYAQSEVQEKKVLREFRGVRLGFKPEQVHAALGRPTDSTDSREEFNFDIDNQITIHYEKGEVKAIQIFFTDSSKAPDWADVVGDADIEEMEGGAKIARKVVSSENFWVSRYQSKDGSIVRITISVITK